MFPEGSRTQTYGDLGVFVIIWHRTNLVSEEIPVLPIEWPAQSDTSRFGAHWLRTCVDITRLTSNPANPCPLFACPVIDSAPDWVAALRPMSTLRLDRRRNHVPSKYCVPRKLLIRRSCTCFVEKPGYASASIIRVWSVHFMPLLNFHRPTSLSSNDCMAIQSASSCNERNGSIRQSQDQLSSR